jgi:hypothetical protein
MKKLLLNLTLIDILSILVKNVTHTMSHTYSYEKNIIDPDPDTYSFYTGNTGKKYYTHTQCHIYIYSPYFK